MALCPNGHQSTDDDYCSVCGVAIVAAPVPGAPASVAPIASAGGTGGAAAAAVSGGARGGAGDIAPMLASCPDCGTTRSDMTSRFCEVCRYDFEMLESYDPANAPAPNPALTPSAPPPVPSTPSRPPSMPPSMSPPPQPSQQTAPPSMPPPAADPDPDPAPSPAPATAIAAAVAPGPTWEVRVAVDVSLDTEPDPDLPAPTDEPDYFFPIGQDEMLIGRRDDRQQIRPQIPLRDPGVSRRHAMLRRDADGISILDLDSTNGTEVNGDPLPPNSRRLLKDGDVVTIGRWTRITLRGGM